MPESERNQSLLQIKDLKKFEFSNGIDLIQQIEDRHQKPINKFYRLQLTEVTFQGQQCLGAYFVDETENRSNKNFQEQLNTWKNVLLTFLESMKSDLTLLDNLCNDTALQSLNNKKIPDFITRIAATGTCLSLVRSLFETWYQLKMNQYIPELTPFVFFEAFLNICDGFIKKENKSLYDIFVVKFDSNCVFQRVRADLNLFKQLTYVQLLHAYTNHDFTAENEKIQVQLYGQMILDDSPEGRRGEGYVSNSQQMLIQSKVSYSKKQSYPTNTSSAHQTTQNE